MTWQKDRYATTQGMCHFSVEIEVLTPTTKIRMKRKPGKRTMCALNSFFIVVPINCVRVKIYTFLHDKADRTISVNLRQYLLENNIISCAKSACDFRYR